MDVSKKKASRVKVRQSIAHIPSSSRNDKLDKQNVTIDIAASRSSQINSVQTVRKRARGKSLGAGGLEALQETDGNVNKNGPAFQPKSILKPSVPLTPPKTIPTFDELRQRSTRKRSAEKSGTEALLIDFSTPGPNHHGDINLNDGFSHQVLDPFSPLKTVKTTNEIHISDVTDLDEEMRVRQEHKQAILQQRAARRKSMANRRVSFAPEATLHTWSVMEMVEDSTTSSASNSTRRQSSLTVSQTPQPDTKSLDSESEVSETHSSSPKVGDDVTAKQSPPHHGGPLQRDRRRSSTISENADASGDEVYSSSPSGDVATGSSPIRVEDGIESDSDTDGDTAMSMDEMTQDTAHSQGSGSSTHSSLEERLRQAANHAGTRGIAYDEYGDDASMEIANDTVTNAFQPWIQTQNQKYRQDPMEDQENINLYSPTTKAHAIQNIAERVENDDTGGMTMEMTRAVGTIISTGTQDSDSRKNPAPSRRRSSIRRRQSLAADLSNEDETMDFTAVAGGILDDRNLEENDAGDAADEDLTMELTTAFGYVQNRDSLDQNGSVSNHENDTMDLTSAMGGILAPIEEQTEPQTDIEGDSTMAMDITRAVGQILTNAKSKQDRAQDTSIQTSMHAKGNPFEAESSLEVDEELAASTPKQMASIASETGSPSLAPKSRSSSRRRSVRTSQMSTPKSTVAGTPPRESSATKQATPTKQLTTVPARATTPERTPMSAKPVHRGVSPKKLFQEVIQSRASPASVTRTSGKQKDPLFAQDEITGRQTPRVVLHAPKPHQHLRRRSSNVGIDQEGFGSPSVTQLLARRTSIGDAAPQFRLEPSQTPRLRFEDPRRLAEEVDAERAEEERRESGRFVMEQEVNGPEGENTTLQLKDMIDSMTPKKNTGSKTKGRKSLAVGSARGLLGKRPMELDEEDDEDTPKRLKAVSREGSPVKKVHLPKPPSKEETTGRLTRAEQKALAALTDVQTPVLSQSPFGTGDVDSPQQSNRFKDVSQDRITEQWTSFEDKLDNVVGAVDPSIEHPPAGKAVSEEDKISLQQFLNMTNIHFIELSTTKRRHTMAQASAENERDADQMQNGTSNACFIAAATTIPQLELYQHATKELKSYISTGRKIVRSIEAETLAEQPALFKEYIEARPDVKAVMDNQFRNGKTNARLQSKEGWYAWRSQLVDGLRSELVSIQNDIEKDLILVEEQAEKLTTTVSQVSDHHDTVTQELALLQQKLDQFANIDHQALKASRKGLRSLDSQFQEKRRELDELERQMQEKDEALSQAAELREELRDQILEANRVRDEHRGLATKDVLALKSKVDATKKEFGWSLVSAEEDLSDPNDLGVGLTMTCKEALRLFFYPSAFGYRADNAARRRSGRNSRITAEPTAPISLTYGPSMESSTLHSNISTEHRFFLQLIQSHLHALSVMPRGTVTTKTVLDATSSGWEMARKTAEEIRLLALQGMTKVLIQGDDKLAVKLMLICADRSRIDIEFAMLISILDDGNFSAASSVSATAIYGPATGTLDASRLRKVQNALGKEIENKELGEGAWISAVQGFEGWYSTHALNQKPSDNTTGRKEPEPVEEQVTEGSTTPKSPTVAATQIKSAGLRRSPLASKKTSVVQKKAIPIPTARQEKPRPLQQQQQPQQPPPSAVKLEKTQVTAAMQEAAKDKENLDPFTYSNLDFKPPAITPEMQEVMMQRTPIKRVGALRRSPI